jgi:2-polyprenyl-6-methoxyphenol hydroxylase-like FAD-dependent oxidoreductase
MKRSRLASLLQEEAMRRGIRVEYGRRLADAAFDPSGRVTATFQDGGDAAGDLLIGADGIQSVVRQIIDPNAPTGRYVGLTNFGGFTAGAAGDIEPEAWHMIFGRSAFFGYTATPQGDVVWFANLPRPMITAEEKASTSLENWKRQLVKVFAIDTGPAVELIESGKLELAADNTHDLGHVPTWHRGPVVIIGDAAHAPAPSSGQGASMAIEDAIVLARSLRDQPVIHEALKAYEEQRRQRVEKIVAWGARGSSHKTPGPVGRLTRDLMLPLLFKYAITEKSTGWMYDYRVRLDQSVTT